MTTGNTPASQGLDTAAADAAAREAADARKPMPARAMTVEEKIRQMTSDAVRTKAYRLSARITAVLESIWLMNESVADAADQSAADAATLQMVAILRADLTRLHTLCFYHPDTTAHAKQISLDFWPD